MLILFSVSLFIVLLNFAYFRYRHGVMAALGTSIIASFWFPLYWKLEVLGMPISVQTASTVLCVSLYTLTGGSLKFRLNLLDVAVGAIAVTQAISDGWVHGEGPLAIVRGYGEWMLPYASGRYAFGSIAAMKVARPHLLAFFGIALSVWAIDLFAGTNPCFDLTEMLADWEPPRRGKRYSMVRSAGLATHPIFFSALLMAMLPIAIASCGYSSRNRFIGRYLLGAAFMGGSFVLLSRAAILAVLVSATGLVASINRKFFVGALAAIAVAAILVGMNFEKAKETWKKTGDFSDQRVRVIQINGEEKMHSSTLARIRIYDVYGKAAKNAGFFGYGTRAFDVEDGPPNIPYLPVETNASDTVWTVDNSYLLIVLRFGWVGGAAFVLLALVPLTVVPLAVEYEVRGPLMIFVTSTISISILLATVYADYQIVLPYLFLMGLISAVVDNRVQSQVSYRSGNLS